MQTPDYSIIIPYKVRDIISLISEKRHVDFFDALNLLYKSKLYEFLCEESTKLWHLSPHKLLDLLETEERKNIFEFPDFV
jgi:hypothetical protein